MYERKPVAPFLLLRTVTAVRRARRAWGVAALMVRCTGARPDPRYARCGVEQARLCGGAQRGIAHGARIQHRCAGGGAAEEGRDRPGGSPGWHCGRVCSSGRPAGSCCRVSDTFWRACDARGDRRSTHARRRR
jgi:hypothetical protein